MIRYEENYLEFNIVMGYSNVAEFKISNKSKDWFHQQLFVKYIKIDFTIGVRLHIWNWIDYI